MNKLTHVPVLLEEAVTALAIKPGAVIVDGTFGRGGHSREIYKMLGKDGHLIGIDRDPVMIVRAREEWKKENVILEQAGFAELADILDKYHINKIDGLLLDLGMSSVQLDDLKRGFNWQNEEANLDLRMGDTEKTAADIINHYSTGELERVFQDWGDIYSQRFIRKLVSSRRAKFLKTRDLMTVVKAVFPRNERNVYGRIWQALRMEVNDEIGQLKMVLEEGIKRLNSGGRLVVISFHSGEDRVVKDFFRKLSQRCQCPPELPQCVCQTKPILKIINKKAVKPSLGEITKNIRSKSARMRVAEKI